jgi:hypothetical protein
MRQWCVVGVVGALVWGLSCVAVGAQEQARNLLVPYFQFGPGPQTNPDARDTLPVVINTCPAPLDLAISLYNRASVFQCGRTAPLGPLASWDASIADFARANCGASQLQGLFDEGTQSWRGYVTLNSRLPATQVAPEAECLVGRVHQARLQRGQASGFNLPGYAEAADLSVFTLAPGEAFVVPFLVGQTGLTLETRAIFWAASIADGLCLSPGGLDNQVPLINHGGVVFQAQVPPFEAEQSTIAVSTIRPPAFGSLDGWGLVENLCPQDISALCYADETASEAFQSLAMRNFEAIFPCQRIRAEP